MKNKKLIIFDVDNTLVKLNKPFQHIWEIINHYYGVQDEDNQLYELWKQNKISYNQWVRKDFELYVQKGFNQQHLTEIFKNTQIESGIYSFLDNLKKKNKFLAVVSGSLDLLLKHYSLDSFFDKMHINHIEFSKNGEYLNFKTSSTYFDCSRKEYGVKELASFYKLNIEDCIYIGDGDNDIQVMNFMRNNNAIGISFNGSKKLESLANYIHRGDLISLEEVLI